MLAGPSELVKFGHKYMCKATVIGFEVDNGWYYTGYTNCTRKLPPPETNLGCQICNLSPIESMPWYRLETVVEDSSGHAVFTVLGEVGDKLIGEPAFILANSPIMDLQCVHPLMDRIIGQTRIFHVTLRENNFGDSSVQFVVQHVEMPERDEGIAIPGGDAVTTTTLGTNAESSSSSSMLKRRLSFMIDH